MIAVLESTAQSQATAALKGVAGLSRDEWLARHRWQFKQITETLIVAAKPIDSALFALAQQLDELRSQGQDIRHRIIHATWGQNDELQRVNTYDERRRLWITEDDIPKGLHLLDQLAGCAHKTAFRTAELIQAGVLPGGGERSGIAMYVSDKLVWF
jgi:hypothetical protein